jgi:hypothetical protein
LASRPKKKGIVYIEKGVNRDKDRGIYKTLVGDPHPGSTPRCAQPSLRFGVEQE